MGLSPENQPSDGPLPPPLPPDLGGIMVWLPPKPESRWLRVFLRDPGLRVDRRRWRANRPVTFLIAPAGRRRLQLREPTGRGELVSVQAAIDVYPGQWRRLTVDPEQGRTAYPALLDERGVNINAGPPPGRKQGMLALLGFLVLIVGFVALCWLGLYLPDRH
jgi:hypothetical protein